MLMRNNEITKNETQPVQFIERVKLRSGRMMIIMYVAAVEMSWVDGWMD